MEPILQYIPEPDYKSKYLDLLKKYSKLQDTVIQLLKEAIDED